MELDQDIKARLLRLSDDARLHYFGLRIVTSRPKVLACQPLMRVPQDFRPWYFVLTSLLDECPFDADAESVRGILGELFPKLTIAHVGEILDALELTGLLCRVEHGDGRPGWWMPLNSTGAVTEPPKFEEMPGQLRKAFAECLARARLN